MSDLPPLDQRYSIRVHGAETSHGELVFSFSPNGLQQLRGRNGVPKQVSRYIFAGLQEQGIQAFQWRDKSPNKLARAHMEELEREAANRLKERSDWFVRINQLVSEVELWVKELGWATRRIEKKLEDFRIGTNRVPALLMQEDTCRIILEPLGVSAPGVEGVVDLYLMPAYDDIARLYFDHDHWNLQYRSPNTRAIDPISEAETLPLTRETLRRVLEEMRLHVV